MYLLLFLLNIIIPRIIDIAVLPPLIINVNYLLINFIIPYVLKITNLKMPHF